MPRQIAKTKVYFRVSPSSKIFSSCLCFCPPQPIPKYRLLDLGHTVQGTPQETKNWGKADQSSSSSSLQTSSSLRLACPWGVTRRQVLWDGIFTHWHGKPGTSAAVIPAWQLPSTAGTKIHQLLPSSTALLPVR